MNREEFTAKLIMLGWTTDRYKRDYRHTNNLIEVEIFNNYADIFKPSAYFKINVSFEYAFNKIMENYHK